MFEFKYKNETNEIKAEMANKNEEVQDIDAEIDILEESILEWLEDRFPEFKGPHFLLSLINNKFKDYLSILGVKQSKRQCTPLKLNRYIKVLNYLHRQGGMSESDLRALIVKDEVGLNVGFMHKRSLMGILEGLKGLDIIVEVDGIYQPGWFNEDQWIKREGTILRGMNDEDLGEQPKKKLHVESEAVSLEKKQKKGKKPKINGASKDNDKPHYNRISEHKYKSELFTAVLTVNLQKAVVRCFRKAFNRIIYVDRKKNLQKFVPQLHVLNLLENDEKADITFASHLDEFYRELDLIAEDRGRLED